MVLERSWTWRSTRFWAWRQEPRHRLVIVCPGGREEDTSLSRARSAYDASRFRISSLEFKEKRWTFIKRKAEPAPIMPLPSPSTNGEGNQLEVDRGTFDGTSWTSWTVVRREHQTGSSWLMNCHWANVMFLYSNKLINWTIAQNKEDAWNMPTIHLYYTIKDGVIKV